MARSLRSLQVLIALTLLGLLVTPLRAQHLPDVRISPTLSITPQPSVASQSAAKVGDHTLVAFTTTQPATTFAVATTVAYTLIRGSVPDSTHILAGATGAIDGSVAVLGSSRRFYLLWRAPGGVVRMQIFDLDGEPIGQPVVAATGTTLGNAEQRWVLEGTDTTRLVIVNGMQNTVPSYLIITVDSNDRLIASRGYAPGWDFYDNVVELSALPGARVVRNGDAPGEFIHADGRIDPRPVPPTLIQSTFVVDPDSSLWSVAIEGNGADLTENNVVILHYPSLFDSSIVERRPIVDTLFNPYYFPYPIVASILNRNSAGDWVVLIATDISPIPDQGEAYRIYTEWCTVDSLGHVHDRTDLYEVGQGPQLSPYEYDGGYFNVGAVTLDYGFILITLQDEARHYSQSVMTKETKKTYNWVYDPQLRSVGSTLTEVSGYYSTSERKWISSTSSSGSLYDPRALDSGKAYAEIAPPSSSAMRIIPITRATSSDSSVVILSSSPSVRCSLPRPSVIDTVPVKHPALALNGDTLATLWTARGGVVGTLSPSMTTPWSYVGTAGTTYTTVPGGAIAAEAVAHAAPNFDDFDMWVKVLTPHGMEEAYSSSSHQTNFVSISPRVTRNPRTGEVAARYSIGTTRVVVDVKSGGVRTHQQSADASTTAYPIIVDSTRTISADYDHAYLMRHDSIIGRLVFADKRANKQATWLLPTVNNTFLRLFPLNEIVNGRQRRWHAELYRFDLSLADSISFLAPGTDYEHSMVFHNPSQGIGILWGSSNGGVRLTLFRRDLRLVADDLQVNNDTLATSAPVGVFKDDTLFALWEDRREGTQQIYGGGMVLTGALRDSLFSGRAAPLDTVAIAPDGIDSIRITGGLPDQAGPVDTTNNPPDGTDPVDTTRNRIDKSIASGGITLLPMPVQDRATVIIDSIAAGSVTLQLHDMQGALRWSLEIPDQRAGRFEQMMDITSLPRGVYKLTVQHSGGILSRTLVIDR